MSPAGLRGVEGFQSPRFSFVGGFPHAEGMGDEGKSKLSFLVEDQKNK
jgi:hypothetical protein